MRHCKLWLTIALSFTALSAVKADKNTELPLEPPFDPQVIPVTLYERQEIPVTLYDGDIGDKDKDMMKYLVRDFMDTNPEEVNGEPLFEGDIVLTQNQWRALKERKGLSFENYRWTEGSDGYPLVPYIFTDSRLNQQAIKNSMQHWQTHTCIKFTETSNTAQRHLRFIYGGGCYSSIGMTPRNGQDISIGQNCDTLGIVAHEIGHAMGFFHEQSRPDRDEHVVINSENIRSDRMNNFNKYGTNYINTYGIPYDYSSDMHYSSRGFTINGETTLATKDPFMQTIIGQRTGLSHRDKLMANKMYKCIDKWLAACGKSADTCQNGGYFGANCACICPPGTSGSNCETNTGDYYAALRNSCDQEITQEGTVTSPNHPNAYSAGECVTVIKAPKCYLPKLTFSSFTLYGKNPYCYQGVACCYFDALEIRANNKYNGELYCGNDITPGQSFTAAQSEMVLYFRAKSWWNPGWSAQVTFVKQDGCQ